MTNRFNVKWAKTKEGKIDGVESIYTTQEVKDIVSILEPGEIIEVTRV